MTVDERVIANSKNANIESVSAFGKSMPSPFDSEAQLRVGDVLEIPSVLQVYQQKFGNNFGEFIVVKIIGADGVERSMNFFPSSLTRNFWPATKDAAGTVQTVLENGPLNPKGSAVEFFLSFRGKGNDAKSDTQVAMEALMGKKIKISALSPVDVQAWRNGNPTNSIRHTQVPTYDLV